MDTSSSFMQAGGLTKVLGKLFSYLRCQRKALVKKNIISTEMDESFQELMMEMNEFLFNQFEDHPSTVKSQNIQVYDHEQQEQVSVYLPSPTPPPISKRISIMSNENMQETLSYACLFCSEDFQSTADLQNHTKENHEDYVQDGEFECGICGVLFSDVVELKRHERIHGSTEENLKHAMKRNHRKNQKEDESTSPVAKRSTRIAEKLTQNEVSDIPIPSDITIDTDTVSQDEINVYIENLKEEDFSKSYAKADQPFICKFCGASYVYFTGLMKHIVKHANRKLYKCNYCTSKFLSASALSRHVSSTHLKLKPFSCKICEKRFTLRGTLKEHMFIHTGEKPYVCEVCSKQFSSRSYRSQHRRKYHNGGDYTCSICCMDFKNEITFREHVLVHATADAKEEEPEEDHSNDMEEEGDQEC